MTTPSERQRPPAHQPTLFELPADPPAAAPSITATRGRPRLRTANREQIVFRTDHVELLDGWLTQSVAALMAEGLVELNRVAQDGMRVRASAGAASFRRRPTLEEALTEAQQQVEALRQEVEEDPSATDRRQK